MEGLHTKHLSTPWTLYQLRKANGDQTITFGVENVTLGLLAKQVVTASQLPYSKERQGEGHARQKPRKQYSVVKTQHFNEELRVPSLVWGTKIPNTVRHGQK